MARQRVKAERLKDRRPDKAASLTGRDWKSQLKHSHLIDDDAAEFSTFEKDMIEDTRFVVLKKE